MRFPEGDRTGNRPNITTDESLDILSAGTRSLLMSLALRKSISSLGAAKYKLLASERRDPIIPGEYGAAK